MKNIAQKQTIEVYKLLRRDDQPWVASLIAGRATQNAEGSTPSEALARLASVIWPKV